MGVRILSAADVEMLLSPADCLAAVEEAFLAWGRGEVAAPGILGAHSGEGAFHIKAASMRVGGRVYFAAKTNGNFPMNPERHGLPSIQGVLILSDAERGTPLAIMDSAHLTVLRTASASAVAARRLAGRDATTLTVVGCGAQAESQVRALHLVRPLTRVKLLDRDRARAHALAARLRGRLDAEMEIVDDLAAAVRSTDMCVTCTTATSAFLTLDMVPPGGFVAAVGADNPKKHEIDERLLASSKVVVDSLDQCATIGDLHHALDAGAMERSDVHAELGEVVAGLAPAREHDDEIIVFDSTGVALQDVAAAAIVHERAEAEGHGLLAELAPVAV